MASGFAGDKVNGLPFTGTIVTKNVSMPRTQTVLDTRRLARVVIQRTASDRGHIASGPGKNNTYHQ